MFLVAPTAYENTGDIGHPQVRSPAPTVAGAGTEGGLLNSFDWISVIEQSPELQSPLRIRYDRMVAVALHSLLTSYFRASTGSTFAAPTTTRSARPRSSAEPLRLW